MKPGGLLEFETAGGVTIHSSRGKNAAAAAPLALFTLLSALSVWSFFHYPTGKGDIWYEIGLGVLTAYVLALTLQLAIRAVWPESLNISPSGLAHHWLFGVRRWDWSEIDSPYIARTGFRGLFVNVRFAERMAGGALKQVSLPLFWTERPERIAGMIATAIEQANARTGGFAETVRASGDLRMRRGDPIRVRRWAFAIAAVLLSGYLIWSWVSGRGL